jgi:Sap, sulfolipid-1-addressing protein
MWGTVFLMAIVAVADPVRIGAVAFMLSRTRPMGLLLAYFTAAFATNLMVGAVVLFVLRDARLAPTASAARKTEIAIGLLALLVGALVVWGVPALLRYRAPTRHTGPCGAEGDTAATHSGTTAIGRPAVKRPPGFNKLLTRTRAALLSESLWVGWIVGLVMGLPPGYYLVAIAAILTSGAAAGSQILGLLMFNLVAFGVAEIPIVSFSVAPDATRACLEQFTVWTKAHYRLVVGTLAGAVGILFLVIGFSQRLAT